MSRAVPATAVPVSPGVPARSAVSLLAELVHDRAALLSAVFLLALAVAAVLADIVAPHDPAQQVLRARLLPPVWLEKGDWQYLLGTDHLGRDVLSRIIHGARASLGIALWAVGLSAAFGVLAGLAAGYLGGRVDAFIMRVVDTQLAFPDLLLALTVLSVIGATPVTLVVVLAVSGWMVFARMTRGVVVSARQEGYVEAAELIGCRPWRVILRHILPNLGASLVTLSIIELARVLLAEAALSFLGMGIQPPASSWGLDISLGKAHIFGAWWLVTFPGMAIALTILSANLLAQWVRATLDAQARDRRAAMVIAARESRQARRRHWRKVLS